VVRRLGRVRHIVRCFAAGQHANGRVVCLDGTWRTWESRRDRVATSRSDAARPLVPARARTRLSPRRCAKERTCAATARARAGHAPDAREFLGGHRREVRGRPSRGKEGHDRNDTRHRRPESPRLRAEGPSAHKEATARAAQATARLAENTLLTRSQQRAVQRRSADRPPSSVNGQRDARRTDDRAPLQVILLGVRSRSAMHTLPREWPGRVARYTNDRVEWQGRVARCTNDRAE
jgi:hypothetical protein